MTVYLLLLLVSATVADYGPVDVNQTDPLSLSWNQVHWLVREYISEVEELKAEHDAIYNEITGEANYHVTNWWCMLCYGWRFLCIGPETET